MSKPKDRDRRSVVEQMRKDQKRREKHRTYAVAAGCTLVAVAIVGVAAIPLVKQDRASSGDLETLGASVDAADCQDLVTRTAKGNNDHRPETTHIAYDNAPPAFGPHYPQPAEFARKFYTAEDRPAVEYLVHNLEHGYNLLWYDETVADDADQLNAVRGIASKFEGQKLIDKFIAVPWTEQDGKAFPDGAHVALTHWSLGEDPGKQKQVGVWQYCSRPSGAVVDQFTRDYPFTDSPEPNAM